MKNLHEGFRLHYSTTASDHFVRPVTRNNKNSGDGGNNTKQTIPVPGNELPARLQDMAFFSRISR